MIDKVDDLRLALTQARKRLEACAINLARVTCGPHSHEQKAGATELLVRAAIGYDLAHTRYLTGDLLP